MRKKQKDDAQPICGLVMPISPIDGCNESHWLEVKSILSDAIEQSECKANLVSDADEVGIIQKRIIQNLYDNPIVVCDVSGKNPNVMFELGMRLAFDKPTIIVKDDATTYSFDTSPIEHLEYPRDLRFPLIVKFKESLTKKISATIEKASNDSSYTTFLKHFGKFTVARLETEEVSKEDYIIEEIKELKHYLRRRELDTIAVHDIRNKRLDNMPGKEKFHMRIAFQEAVSEVAKAKGGTVQFPEDEGIVREILLNNVELTEKFPSKKEFDECFKEIVYRG